MSGKIWFNEIHGWIANTCFMSENKRESYEFVTSYRMRFALAVAHMAERIGYVAYVNKTVSWDETQCVLSPGIRCLALIICSLIDATALYRMKEFYQDYDTELLFGAGIQAEHFSDDSLGRGLLKLALLDLEVWFGNLADQAVAAFALPASSRFHGDTTSLTLWGKYADPQGGVVTIRMGTQSVSKWWRDRFVDPMGFPWRYRFAMGIIVTTNEVVRPLKS